ncbi:MAG: HAMP domain-containing protein, partial [bacterium]
MSWFTNLMTRTKLFLGFGAIIALMAIAIFTAYQAMGAVADRHRNVELLHNLDGNFSEQRVVILTMQSTSDPSALASLRTQLTTISAINDGVTRELQESTRDNPALVAGVEEFINLRAPYTQTRDEQTVPLIVAGKAAEARTLVFGIQQERYTKLSELSEALRVMSLQQAQSAERRAQLILTAVGVAAVIAALFIVILLTRVIARPLGEISHAARQIAAGDLDVVSNDTERRDEVGALAQTFALMTRSLQEMASIARQIAGSDLRATVTPRSDKDALGNAFATMVENLRRTTAELSEGVNVLAASASEILASTTQIASGA